MNLIILSFFFCIYAVISTYGDLDNSLLLQVAQEMNKTNQMLECISNNNKHIVSAFEKLIDNYTYNFVANELLRRDSLTLKAVDDEKYRYNSDQALSTTKLNFYKNTEVKLFGEYSKLKKNLSYDTEVQKRRIIMKNIFQKYLQYKVDNMASSMCSNSAIIDVRCKLFALERSTDESVHTYEFEPRCVSNSCYIDPKNIIEYEVLIRESMGNGPGIFNQMYDGTFTYKISHTIMGSKEVEWLKIKKRT
ncbi:uncharacterized protein LOC126896733 isoform X2 [Daktulosphaira vitifoliae]|uniref:uncharacterized protein LOC126896733 isoform X2 n=1 Tax=Daktulosphaira vitifoliae TaxID=58002 RepID=UPI0021AAD484|nr:uncharacterized protein LOC126896733 isoform X2 [Daktulosphaira vitifoliae]